MAEREEYPVEGQQQNSFEAFILRYQKLLSAGLGAILVLILGYLGLTNWYLPSQNQKAQTEIFHAQRYFGNDSLDKALNGDGQHPGFKDIIDDYGWTQTANLAHYYTGVIYLKKGQFDKAIDHLESFDTESKVLEPLAYGNLGNAYSEKGDYKQAADYYLKAAKAKDNKFTSPIYFMKAGMALEEVGNYKKALETYKTLKEDYPESNQASNIEKYIARVKAKIHAQKS